MSFGRATAACCLICAIGLTLYFSVIADKPLPYHYTIDGYNDLLLHLAAFAALTFLTMLLWPRPVIVCVVLFTLGVLIEVGQIFNPLRTVSVSDIGANGAGVIVGMMLFWLVNRLSIFSGAADSLTDNKVG